MGLIGRAATFPHGYGTALFAETRMIALVRQERALLEQALGNLPYELVDVDTTQCLVVTDTFTVAISWWWREQWIASEIRIHEPYDHPLADRLILEHATRAFLNAQGLPAPPPATGPKTAAMLRDELALLHQAVGQILCDQSALGEAFFYLTASRS